MRLSQQTDRRRLIGSTADPVSKPGALVPHLLLAIGHQFLRHVEVDRLPAGVVQVQQSRARRHVITQQPAHTWPAERVTNPTAALIGLHDHPVHRGRSELEQGAVFQHRRAQHIGRGHGGGGIDIHAAVDRRLPVPPTLLDRSQCRIVWVGTLAGKEATVGVRESVMDESNRCCRPLRIQGPIEDA